MYIIYIYILYYIYILGLYWDLGETPPSNWTKGKQRFERFSLWLLARAISASFRSVTGGLGAWCRGPREGLSISFSKISTCAEVRCINRIQQGHFRPQASASAIAAIHKVVQDVSHVFCHAFHRALQCSPSEHSEKWIKMGRQFAAWDPVSCFCRRARPQEAFCTEQVSDSASARAKSR